jgi:hypothetical protein
MHRARRKIAHATALILLIAGLAGCKSAQVTGEVRDGFGNPLPGATVSVDKTTFTATTDTYGRYGVEYVPGKVLVGFAKAGYTSQSLALDIATETKYPAQAVTLYKLPAERGIFAFSASDYTPLERGQLSGSYVDSVATIYGTGSTTYTVAGNYVPIDGSNGLTFIDTDEHKLDIYGVGPGGLILSHSYAFNTTTAGALFHDDVVQIAPGVRIRRARLAKGKYAFCAPYSMDYQRPQTAIAYLIEVK